MSGRFYDMIKDKLVQLNVLLLLQESLSNHELYVDILLEIRKREENLSGFAILLPTKP